MNKMAGYFMKSAVIYGVIALLLGVYMGASQKMSLLSTHSHVSLLGWVTFAICAFYYHLVPAAAGLTLAKIHFWTATIGLVGLAAGLVFKSSGMTGAEPVLAAGSVMSLAGLSMFLYVVFRTTGRSAGK